MHCYLQVTLDTLDLHQFSGLYYIPLNSSSSSSSSPNIYIESNVEAMHSGMVRYLHLYIILLNAYAHTCLHKYILTCTYTQYICMTMYVYIYIYTSREFVFNSMHMYLYLLYILSLFKLAHTQLHIYICPFMLRVTPRASAKRQGTANYVARLHLVEQLSTDRGRGVNSDFVNTNSSYPAVKINDSLQTGSSVDCL